MGNAVQILVCEGIADRKYVWLIELFCIFMCVLVYDTIRYEMLF